MANSGTPGTLHWGERKLNDHIMLTNLLGSMLEVPVTFKGRMTGEVFTRIRNAVDARSTEDVVYYLDSVTDDAPFGATHTHTAWVCAFPR